MGISKIKKNSSLLAECLDILANCYGNVNQKTNFNFPKNMHEDKYHDDDQNKGYVATWKVAR